MYAFIVATLLLSTVSGTIHRNERSNLQLQSRASVSKFLPVINQNIWPILEHIDKFENVIRISNISKGCYADLNSLIHGLYSHRKWAFQMIDSTAKLDPGTYQMAMTSAGNEQQCLSIKHDHVKGSFAMVSIPFIKGGINISVMKQPGPYWYGKTKNLDNILKYFNYVFTLCHPHSCSMTDISKLIDKYFNHSIDYTIHNTNRTLKRSTTNVQITSLCIISIFTSYVIVSTLKINAFTGIPFGSSHFDIVSNIKTVIRRYNTDDKIKRNTDLLNGWKVIYFFISIFIHSYSVTDKAQVSLSSRLQHYHVSFVSLSTIVSRVILTGICLNLTSTATINSLIMIPFAHKIKNIPKLFIMSTILRYLRLIPILSFIIMMIIIAPLIKINSSGMFHQNLVQTMSDTCSTNGWYAFAMLSNFNFIHSWCLGIAWFLSADFQLSVITFPLFVTLAHDLRKGIKLTFVYFVMGIILEYAVYRHNNQCIIPQYQEMSAFETFPISHMWTSNFITTYAIGLVCGTMTYHNIRLSEENNKKYNNILQSILLAIYCMLAYSTSKMDDWKMDLWLKHLMGSCLRTIETFILASLSYLIGCNESGIANKILTFTPLFNTLSKILLPSFLVHYLLILYFASIPSLKPIEGSLFYIITNCIVIFPVSFMLGLILHIFIELPFIKLTKSLLTR